MTRNFHRWEVDPFFSAAEEVQDSADRLESVFRTWVHMKSAADDNAVIEFHRRELSTALGTAKWQLEEFERAVSYVTVDDSDCAGDDSPTRHKQFVDALRSQISSIETALLSSEDGRDLKPHQVVKLGEKEKQDLELFLCGSRPNACINNQETGPYTAAASEAGKADEVALCTILDPLEGKNGIGPYFSTSAGNSDVDSANVKSDDGLWTHGSNKLRSHLDKVSNGNFVGERIDEISKPVSDPTPDYYLSDRTETYGERANGHLRSVSVGSGLNAWKSGSTNDGRSKNRKLISVQIPSTRLSFWSVFAKAQQPRSWKSGLKRWKDGDANASDSEMLALMQGVRDVEEGNGTLWFGGKMSISESNNGAGGDSKHRRAVGDGFQMWQRSHYALPSSRPVQVASAILVALGLVGLLSFHGIHICHACILRGHPLCSFVLRKIRPAGEDPLKNVRSIFCLRHLRNDQRTTKVLLDFLATDIGEEFRELKETGKGHNLCFKRGCQARSRSNDIILTSGNMCELHLKLLRWSKEAGFLKL